MSQAAAFNPCQMPERSGLPSLVRCTVPDWDCDCGAGTPAPKGANEQRPNSAPISNGEHLLFRTLAAFHRISVRPDSRSLLFRTVNRGASPRGPQEEVTSIGKRDFPAVGNRLAAPREKSFHDDLTSGHEVGLSQAPPHERVCRTGL